MKIGLAGDWHGNNRWAVHAIATFADAGITEVFQLGDFGLGWPKNGDRMFSDVAYACDRYGVNLYVVPGNHENWAWINKLEFSDGKICRLTKHVYVLGRGFRGELPHDRTIVALGGAPSIDSYARTQGIDWWSEEMITLEEATEVANGGHADIMLMHDAPSVSTDAVNDIISHNPQGWPDTAIKYAAEGRYMADIAIRGVKPKVFAHGHFHVADEKQVGDTKFLAVHMNNNEKNLVALDLETLEHEWLPILLELKKT